MKKIVFSLLCLVLIKAQAQENQPIKYYITEARINNEDYSAHYLENGQYLRFYADGSGEIFFLNTMANKEQFSYGKIRASKFSESTENNLKVENESFRWNYHNSYDTDSGWAEVSIKYIYGKERVNFYARIVTDKKEVIEFSGITSENPRREEIKNEHETDEEEPEYLYAKYTSHNQSQRFDLGDGFYPDASDFKLIGISSVTGVKTYKYIRPITDYMFGRKIGDIIIGEKYGRVVTTIYNLIPLKSDADVPQSIVDLIQSALPFPLALVNGVYGVNIDNESISISRSKNALTFNKDRIMYFSSVKQSLLKN